MKIGVDTNVLVRALTDDDPAQAALAKDAMAASETIAVSTVALCELVWVLKRGYGLSDPAIKAALKAIMTTAAVSIDRPAVEAGFAVFDAGGDFADGVIAHQARALGGETFVSFDRRAVAALTSVGVAARVLD